MRVQVGDEESREQLIKDHYMARVGELTSQLQVSDSKAVHFHAEVSRGAPGSQSCFTRGGRHAPHALLPWLTEAPGSVKTNPNQGSQSEEAATHHLLHRVTSCD